LFDIVLSHGDVVWIDDLAAHDGEIAARVGDLILSAGKIISIGNDQVGELAYLDTSLLASWCSSENPPARPSASGQEVVGEMNGQLAGFVQLLWKHSLMKARGSALSY
jgi:hypothetical protein